MPAQDNTQTEDATGALIGQGGYEARNFGTLWLVWSGKGLTSLGLPGAKRPFARGAGPTHGPIPHVVKTVLDTYFAGQQVDLRAVAVDLRGTAFQVRVWEALRRIPYGRTRSYAGIASDIGQARAARAVGMANSKNPVPIVLPCHRVVAVGRKLGGYTGGLDKKRFLLRLEGVKIEGDTVLPGQLDLDV